MKRSLIAGAVLAALAAAASSAPRPLEDVLEPIRARHNLPALAAGVIADGRLAALGAVGVRKHGSTVKARPTDQFHVGSCTKAMTATLIAMLIEQGKLRWDMTPAEALGDPDGTMNAGFRKVTLRHLLCHRAGVVPNVPFTPELLALARPPDGSDVRQRLAYARVALGSAPLSPPGEKYLYSNAGYAVAAAMAEAVTKTPWRDLIRKMLFEPLGMASAGFGAMGTPGKIDQPWQHVLRGEELRAIEPGPDSDNPPAIGPGGRVHCSIADWAKFIAAHLAGPRKAECPIRLKPATWKQLHEPPFGGDYAMGWCVTKRDWGGGEVLTHAGSNTQNFAVVWLAPQRDFAVLVASNLGGGPAPKACDEAAATMIRLFLPPTTAPATQQR